MDKEWLSNLKDGDKVILAQDGMGGFRAIGVARLTPTQIVVIRNAWQDIPYRFRRDNGRVIGSHDRWHAPYLLPYTAEAALHLRTLEMIRRVESVLTKIQRPQIEALGLANCVELHAQLTHVWAALEKMGVMAKKEEG